jgi:endonuclease YncB( thermonuclease family)
MVVLGALATGLATGAGWTWWSEGSTSSGPSSAIEWNAVQPVPKRVPDAEDVEWQKRAAETSPLVGEEGGGPAASAAEGTPSGPPPMARASTVSETVRARHPHDGEGWTGPIYVIDGDTFGIGGRHIRIAGIDAPETHPPRCLEEARLGLAATAKLKELLASGTVTMSGSGVDRYGRELRQVFVNGVDVAGVMISAGLARSYDGGKKQGWC